MNRIMLIIDGNLNLIYIIQILQFLFNGTKQIGLCTNKLHYKLKIQFLVFCFINYYNYNIIIFPNFKIFFFFLVKLNYLTKIHIFQQKYPTRLQLLPNQPLRLYWHFCFVYPNSDYHQQNVFDIAGFLFQV